MIRHSTTVKLIGSLALAWIGLAATTHAAADPNGTWKWTFTTQNGQEFQLSVTLQQDGEKLTGKLTRADTTTEISDGTFKNDEVAFKVIRERDGQKFTAQYKGKVEADSIKGKIGFEFGGETRSFDWNATREKK